MPKTLTRWAGFRDRLGERDVVDDPTGEPVALLRVAGLVATEAALAERMARLAPFDRPSCPPPIRLDRDRDTDRPVLVSEHVPGIRLSDAFHRASKRAVVPDLGASLFVVMRLLAIVDRARAATGITHFGVAPERVIATPGAQLVIVEAAMATDIEARARATADAFGQTVDIERIARLGLSMMYGRQIPEDKYLDPLSPELDDLADVTAIRADQRFASALRLWFEQALVSDPDLSFRGFSHARAAFAAVCAAAGDGRPSRRLFRAFLQALAIDDFETPEALDRESARARAIRGRRAEARWTSTAPDSRPAGSSDAAVLDDLLEELAHSGHAEERAPDAWAQQLISTVHDQEILPDHPIVDPGPTAEVADPSVEPANSEGGRSGVDQGVGAGLLDLEIDLFRAWDDATRPSVTDESKPAEPESLVRPIGFTAPPPVPAPPEEPAAWREAEDPHANGDAAGIVEPFPDYARDRDRWSEASSDLLTPAWNETSAPPGEGSDVVDEPPYSTDGSVEVTGGREPATGDAGELGGSASAWIREALIHLGASSPGEEPIAEEREAPEAADVATELSGDPSSDQGRRETSQDTSSSLSWLHDVFKQLHETTPAEEEPAAAAEWPADADSDLEPVAAAAGSSEEEDASVAPPATGVVADELAAVSEEAALEPLDPLTAFFEPPAGGEPPLASEWLSPEPLIEENAELDAEVDEYAQPAAEIDEPKEADARRHAARPLTRYTPPESVEPAREPLDAFFHRAADTLAQEPPPVLAEALDGDPAPDAARPAADAEPRRHWLSRWIRRKRAAAEPPAEPEPVPSAAEAERPRAPAPSAVPPVTAPPPEPIPATALQPRVEAPAPPSEAVRSAAAAIALAHLSREEKVSARPAPAAPLPYETYLVEEPPRRRFPKAAAVLLLVTGAAFAAYAYRDRLPLPVLPSQDAVVEQPDETATRTGPAASPNQSTGAVTVTSTPPGARVVVDGVNYGATPVTIADLKPGAHTVLIEGATGSVRRQVTIKAGATVSLNEGIYSGFLAVFAPFELQVFSGGQQLGTSDTPRLMVPPGRHELQLVNTRLGFRETRSVVVEPGDTVVINIDPAVGVVRLGSPPGAEVFVDGERVGVTPIGDLSLPVGTHEIVVRHPELGERRLTAAVKPGAPADLRVDFGR